MTTPDIDSIVQQANRLRYFPTRTTARQIAALASQRYTAGMSDKEIAATLRASIREIMGPAPKKMKESPIHPHRTYQSHNPFPPAAPRMKAK